MIYYKCTKLMKFSSCSLVSGIFSQEVAKMASDCMRGNRKYFKVACSVEIHSPGQQGESPFPKSSRPGVNPVWTLI